MFKKENRQEVFSDAETIIGESIKVKGDFNGNGNIIIDGILEGSLKTKNNVLVGEKAHITASIEANEATINGVVIGNLIIKNFLSLGATAKIHGNIECTQISIERGAIINGKLEMAKNLSNISQKNKEEDEETEA
jgi:cytoskeletal protein CcmA (bactofilin family)